MYTQDVYEDVCIDDQHVISACSVQNPRQDFFHEEEWNFSSPRRRGFLRGVTLRYYLQSLMYVISIRLCS